MIAQNHVTNLATQTEATTATDNTKTMTPLRTKQLLDSKLLNMVYPIGSIYMSVNSATPATLFGGTWERFSKGQVLVGVNEDDTDFAAGKTGGEKTHKLTVTEMPSHTHNQIFSLSANGFGDNGRSPMSNNVTTTSQSGASITSTGGDQAHNNLQPFTTVYMWKRTA